MTVNAVNPYWGVINQSFSEAAKTLAKISGSPMRLDADWYRKAWHNGTINLYALSRARDELRSPLSTGQLIDALSVPDRRPAPAPLLTDSLDAQRDLRHEPAWCDTITHQISQFCAAYFDQDQSEWRPDQSRGLYQHWRTALAGKTGRRR